jgi:hypothetical protein
MIVSNILISARCHKRLLRGCNREWVLGDGSVAKNCSTAWRVAKRGSTEAGAQRETSMRNGFATVMLAFWWFSSLAAAYAECAPGTLQGQYIFSGRGFIEPLAPTVQRVHSGFFVFDGIGDLSGRETSSRGGAVATGQTLKGKYTLSADCTGTIVMRSLAIPNLQTHWDIFVTADGRKANMIRTDPGSMAVRNFEK